MNMGAMTARSKPDILIIGHQWWWEVHYPGDGGQQVITANEIHIPAHRPVNIELRTADVIHSFWVPSLHGKVDLLPGNVNFIRIEASEPGSYVGQCAEYCGKQHAEYAHSSHRARSPGLCGVACQSRQARGGTHESRHGNGSRCISGRSLLPMSYGARDSGDGPVRAGSDPHRQPQGDRLRYFSNNNAYLEGWITNAQALKPGCKMPEITRYNGAQLRSVVAYLRQLQ